MLGSSVEPDLLETMNSVRAEIDAVLAAPSPAPDRSSRGRAARESPGCCPNVLPQHLGPEARPPHAQQQDVGEAGVPGGVGDPVEALDVRQLPVGDAQPAEPLRPRPCRSTTMASRCHSRRTLPCACHSASECAHRGGDGLRAGCSVRRLIRLAAPPAPLPVHRLQQLLEGLGEQPHARRPAAGRSPPSSRCPASATDAIVSRASSTSSVRLARGRPWSRKASNVAGGIVLTVSGPISSST